MLEPKGLKDSNFIGMAVAEASPVGSRRATVKGLATMGLFVRKASNSATGYTTGFRTVLLRVAIKLAKLS
jgi:hypothetical protein